MESATARIFRCPKCAVVLELNASGGFTTCPYCNWEGEVHLFEPAAPQIDAPANALPDHAVCTHHPTKRAVEICAGSGDYICSLCAIELEGRVYSADYVNRVGAGSLGQHFQRHLPRPERGAMALPLLAVLPCLWWVAPILVVWAAVLCVRAIRQYRTDPLYQRVVSLPVLILAPCAIGLVCLGGLVAAVALLLGLTGF